MTPFLRGSLLLSLTRYDISLMELSLLKGLDSVVGVLGVDIWLE